MEHITYEADVFSRFDAHIHLLSTVLQVCSYDYFVRYRYIDDIRFFEKRYGLLFLSEWILWPRDVILS